MHGYLGMMSDWIVLRFAPEYERLKYQCQFLLSISDGELVYKLGMAILTGGI